MKNGLHGPSVRPQTLALWGQGLLGRRVSSQHPLPAMLPVARYLLRRGEHLLQTAVVIYPGSATFWFCASDLLALQFPQ